MIRKSVIRLCLFLLVGAGVISCLGVMTIRNHPALSESSILMYTGYTREVCLREYDGQKNWVSDDESVVTVSDGTIKAVSPGKTIVHCVTEDEKDYSCEVEVRKRVSDSYRKLSEEEAAWIASLQLTDGSFSCYEIEENMPARVNPYFSTYAAIALLQSDYDKTNKEKIDAYINWYFSHMNTEQDKNGSVGTIYDYQVNVRGNEVISGEDTGSYDSADSYAAVFLILLCDYYEKYRDAEILNANKEKIDMLVDLLLSLQSHGYTESMQGSGVKYLMNNAEVYCGLQRAFRLYYTLWGSEKRTQLTGCAALLFQDNFDSSWWSGEYYYSVLKGNNDPYYGDGQDWEKLYEFALPQLFPVIFGIKKPGEPESGQVYSDFCRQWNWTMLEYDEQTEGNVTWSLIGYAAATMGDYESVDAFLENLNEWEGDRSYPYYSGDSVWVVLTCEKAFRYYSDLEMRGVEIVK